MLGPDALVELSGALCTFWAAVYEATEARFLASLWRAAGEALVRRSRGARPRTGLQPVSVVGVLCGRFGRHHSDP